MIDPNTDLRLLSQIPLTSDYEHTMLFSSKQEQLNYFDSKRTHTFLDFTYQREEVAVKIPVSVDTVTNCNYVMYKNTSFTDKWFFAFITRKEYVNPNTCRLHIQTDVFQTWMFDIQYRKCYIDRQHVNRWDGSGNPIAYTTEENLDYGTEYETVSVTQYTPYEDLLFLVIVSKGTLHNDASTTPPIVEKEIVPIHNGLPQPLSYYVHPFRRLGGSLTTKVNGVVRSLSNINKALTNLFTHDSSVNNIVSVYVTDYMGRYVNYSGTTADFDGEAFKDVTIADDVHENITTLYVRDMTEYHELTHDFGNKYDGFVRGSESKLMMYPYAVTILSDMKGNQVEIKNEYINDTNLNIRVRGSLGTSNKLSYSVDSYLTHNNVDFEGMSTVTLEKAVINKEPNDLPVLNDYLSAFLQGNRNALQVQRESQLFNAFTGVMGGAFGGGLGAVAGTAVSMGQSYFQIQGLNAKIQDISNVPPSMSSMGGNPYFDYGNGLCGLYVIKKQITVEKRSKLTDYFHMFGYKVGKLEVPVLKSRQHFNYIKTVGCAIHGNIPQEDIQEIRQIFDTGVTLWHGDFIGNYAFENNEV